MYEETVTLRPPRRLTRDQLADLIEIVVDELDSVEADPSVSTYTHDNGDVRFTVILDACDDDYAGRTAGAIVIRDAFASAGVVLVADAPALLTA